MISNKYYDMQAHHHELATIVTRMVAQHGKTAAYENVLLSG